MPALVAPVAERRRCGGSSAQLARRLGFDVLPGGLDADLPWTADEAVLDAVVGADRLAVLRAPRRAAPPPTSTASVGCSDAADRPPFDLAPPELVAELDRVLPPAPLVLLPRRQGRHLNSWFPPAELRQDEPGVLVHPTDAADAGVIDGQRVRVRSAAGAIEGTVDHRPSVGAGSGVDPPRLRTDGRAERRCPDLLDLRRRSAHRYDPSVGRAGHARTGRSAVGRVRAAGRGPIGPLVAAGRARRCRHRGGAATAPPRRRGRRLRSA